MVDLGVVLHKMKEKYERDIGIEGVTASAMDLILNFLYTTTVDLVEENVKEVLDAASLLQISRKFKFILPTKKKLKQICSSVARWGALAGRICKIPRF